MVDPWSAGYYGAVEECTLRLARAITWVRADPDDHGYAHPIEGLLAVVDLNAMKVVKIEDNGVVPLPTQLGNYSEDDGILSKHMDWRTNRTEVRRWRRLVVSFIATVGNYEYGFYWYWYFCQDGTLPLEIEMTGILNTGALADGQTRKYGTLVAPRLYASNHQHFFNVRLDMMGDGLHNNTALVVWFTIGMHHMPRLEVWPVMPVSSSGFSLKPLGFFDRNPALDVPPPVSGHCHDCAPMSSHQGDGS